MKLLQHLFRRKTSTPWLQGEYRVRFALYSTDGKRCAEMRERADGSVHYAERVWVEGTTFRDRMPGKECGPFENHDAAEAAAASSPWFVGEEDLS